MVGLGFNSPCTRQQVLVCLLVQVVLGVINDTLNHKQRPTSFKSDKVKGHTVTHTHANTHTQTQHKVHKINRFIRDQIKVYSTNSYLFSA